MRFTARANSKSHAYLWSVKSPARLPSPVGEATGLHLRLRLRSPIVMFTTCAISPQRALRE